MGEDEEVKRLKRLIQFYFRMLRDVFGLKGDCSEFLYLIFKLRYFIPRRQPCNDEKTHNDKKLIS